jgi:4-hydroxythreonine-4-phosphate dehydrogenase
LSPIVRLAVSLGDPRGIGPEVARRAARQLLQDDASVEVVLLGQQHEDAAGLPLVEVAPFDGTEASAGRVAGLAIEQGVAMIRSGQADALVTAPIHKPALHAAGYSEPGHTELLQRLSGAHDVGMLMAAETTRLGGPLRVLFATTHLALRDVPARITTELLKRQARLLHQALHTDWAIAQPRLALCALNPHASDQGLFGDEEAQVMQPAVSRLRAEGIDISDALPADTVFSRTLRGEFDAVIAPYHDVGMAAFKTVAFGGGVNVTLGLPFVRTSPDHGTAFDIAGQGRADAGSMLESLRLAARLTRARQQRQPALPHGASA